MSPHTPDGSPSYANNDDIHDLAFAKRGCCFWIPFLGSEPTPSSGGSVFWQRIKPVESSPDTPTAAIATNTTTTSATEEPWWVRGWKRIRDWSELVAGPKWKTLLRRFNKKRNNIQYGRQGYGKFQYDPLSYALNFDEGPGQNGHYDNEDLVGRGFSARYSLPPMSAKSSIDFDREWGERMIFT